MTSIRTASAAAAVLYLFVILEFLYMITPFLAFAYYAAYGQFLGALNQTPWTAWLTSFFLPHFSQTEPNWPHQFVVWGRWLGLAGLVGFIVTAGQIYYAKLARKGMVKGGLYSVVRHPQYAFLMMLGLGTLMIWPRFLVLYALALMIFLYIVLARHEEQICLDKFGPSYAAYLKRAGMFFPRLLPAGDAPAGFTATGAAMVFAICMSVATAIGFGGREYTLNAVSAVWRDREVLISPAILNDAELQRIAALAAADPAVQGLRAAAPEDAQWLIYVVPEEWYLPDLPIDPLEYAAQHGGHGARRDFDRSRWQVLFTTARSWNETARGKDIVRHAYGKTPVALATVRLDGHGVESVATPPPHVVWGDIPMPAF